MNLFNAVVMFCALHPGSTNLSDKELDAKQQTCIKEVTTCVDKHYLKKWTDINVSSCLDLYNKEHRKTWECVNDIKGDCVK